MVVKNFINKIKHGGAAPPKTPQSFKKKVSRFFMSNAQKKVANTTIINSKQKKYTALATKKQIAIDTLTQQLKHKQTKLSTLQQSALPTTAPTETPGLLTVKQIKKTLKQKANSENKKAKEIKTRQTKIALLEQQLTDKQTRMNSRFAKIFAAVNAKVARKVASTLPPGSQVDTPVDTPKVTTKITADIVQERLAAASESLRKTHNNNVQRQINNSYAKKQQKIEPLKAELETAKKTKDETLNPLNEQINSKTQEARKLAEEIVAMDSTSNKLQKSEKLKKYKELLNGIKKDKTARNIASAEQNKLVNQATQSVRRAESAINLTRPLTLEQLQIRATQNSKKGLLLKKNNNKYRNIVRLLPFKRLSTETLTNKKINLTNRRAYAAEYASRLIDKTRPEKLRAIELQLEKLQDPSQTFLFRETRIAALKEKKKRFKLAQAKLNEIRALNNKPVTKVPVASADPALAPAQTSVVSGTPALAPVPSSAQASGQSPVQASVQSPVPAQAPTTPIPAQVLSTNPALATNPAQASVQVTPNTATPNSEFRYSTSAEIAAKKKENLLLASKKIKTPEEIAAEKKANNNDAIQLSKFLNFNAQNNIKTENPDIYKPSAQDYEIRSALNSSRSAVTAYGKAVASTAKQNKLKETFMNPNKERGARIRASINKSLNKKLNRANTIINTAGDLITKYKTQTQTQTTNTASPTAAPTIPASGLAASNPVFVKNPVDAELKIKAEDKQKKSNMLNELKALNNKKFSELKNVYLNGYKILEQNFINGSPNKKVENKNLKQLFGNSKRSSNNSIREMTREQFVELLFKNPNIFSNE